MSRLLATVWCDVRLQARNGFYAATAFVTVLWALLLLQANSLDMRWLLPPLVVGNLLLGTFFFTGGLVLLERGEGSLAAQAVTPLRIGEYLASKVATLSLLAIAETLVIVPMLAGWRFNSVLLVAGVVLAAAIYCLAGFVAVARYESVNEYLFPAGAYVSALWVPLLAYTTQWHHWLLYLHPLTAALVLVQAAFEPVAPWRVVYGLGYSLVWVALLYLGSRSAFRRWIIGR